MREEPTDDWVDAELRRALRGRPAATAPDFAATLKAAEQRQSPDRHRLYTSGAIAAVLGVVAIGLALQWSAPEPGPPSDSYRISEALMSSTQWQAPSDALLPQHRIDIYGDIPDLPGSTESTQGTLL